MAMPSNIFSYISVMPPRKIPCDNAYKGAVEPAFSLLLNIVTMARINPTIAAGNISAGIFQPIAAPEKHKANKIPVLFTAPSRVILSLKGKLSV